MFKSSPENKPIYEGSLGIFKVITSRISQTLCKPYLGRSGKSSRCTSPPQQAGVAKALPAWVTANSAFVLRFARRVGVIAHVRRLWAYRSTFSPAAVCLPGRCGVRSPCPVSGCVAASGVRCSGGLVWGASRWGLLPTYLWQKIPQKGTATQKNFMKFLLHFARCFARNLAMGFSCYGGHCRMRFEIMQL